MSSTVGNASYGRNRRRSLPAGSGLRPIQEATLGLAAVPGAAAPGQEGLMLGYGTAANAGRGFFNNKQQIVITQEVADALNQVSQRDQNAVADGAAQGVVLSTGLGGPIGPEGRFEFYLPNVNQYYQDDRAALYVPASQVNAGVGIVAPGSFRQLAALQQGVPAGQVRIKSPLNQRSGYLKVGSKGWLNMINETARGNTQASREAVENAIGQGALYGLAQVFRNNGINVLASLDGNGNVRFALAPGNTIESLAANPQFRRDVANWYSIYGVDPADQAKGAYGAANLALRHANKIVGPNGETNLQAVNQAIVDQFAQTGSARGFGWREGYTLPGQRRGLTAFPLRDAEGNALSDPTNPNGQCAGIVGSGPGVNQTARANGNGFFGLRLYPRTRKHVGTGLNDAGVEAAPTFSCGTTSNYVVNANRQVYQRGGARATANQSLNEQLAERNALLNQTLPPELQNVFSPDALAANYVQWLQNPMATEGTNPFFMVPGGQGRGFSVGAPSQWQSDMSPEEAAVFANTDLNAAFKAQHANAVLQGLLNPRGAANVVDFGKTGGPSGVANPLFQ
ncbi:hypothetical protein pneo_cds_226 [Pandoravirus neocaledonia]|uniref:Uncharacterized protein n=1 Tax=Pandoravirus neocaledonia TaxID=2107708 RepID=A0A2U7UBL8_9VIRU|nr:hypothetical protein pneo_cds_226 [Pandoravirus neocaledonia]AVK75833.1 hypothetical protein pneo_cds_226 [Pandoravirus neocaledonia]